MRKILIALVLAASTVSCTLAQQAVATDSCNALHISFENTVGCYRQAVEHQPLQYFLTSDKPFSGLEQRTYQMTSQSCFSEQLVHASEWIHDVTLYIPDNAQPDRRE